MESNEKQTAHTKSTIFKGGLIKLFAKIWAGCTEVTKDNAKPVGGSADLLPLLSREGWYGEVPVSGT